MNEHRLVLAIANDGTIGHNGSIPWRLQYDLANFKRLTSGHALVMGRTTYDSLPNKKLPGRDLFVVTSRFIIVPVTSDRVIQPCASYSGALGYTRSRPTAWIGGRSCVDFAKSLVGELYLTRVNCSPAGDTRVDVDNVTQGFELYSQEHRFNDDNNEFDFTLEVWKRKV